MIAESIVDEIRGRADIVEIVGEQVPLKRAGKDFRALCPFHHEKTPSFYVVPAKGFYKCFGCGESGDVFTFLMKRGGLAFQDAVRELGNRVGVEVPDPRLGPEAEEPHRILFEAIAFAHEYFRRHLAESGAESKARKYLDQRGIPDAAIERFGIGYAPDGWSGLRTEAHRHGIDDDVLLAAGLIKESERGDDPYDRFRDRLIFPIAELGGRVIAFGGRLLGRSENAPKYLNSPETVVYHKGSLLYGLNWSRGAIRRDGTALVVEGYMDYVSLAARGIENVVAPLGTAMTVEQANLLARYTGKALLLYDSDAAGLKASFRTADALLLAGVHPLIVTLPQGDDPDDIVRQGGAPALKPFLDDAVDVLERKLQMLDERGFFDDIEGVRRALDRLLPTLRATTDPALRDIYTARVAQRTGVRRETLERDLDRKPASLPASEQASSPIRSEHSGPGMPGGPQARAPQPTPKEWAAERLLLLVLVTDATRAAEALELIAVDDLHDPRHREIYRALAEQGERPDGEPLRLSSAAEALYAELRAKSVEIVDSARSFEAAVADIQLEGLSVRHRFLDDQMRSAQDEKVKAAIAMEKFELKREQTLLMQRAPMGFKASRRYRELLSNRRPASTPTPRTPG